MTMFQKFIGINDMVGVYWTLQIELAFYIICVFLAYKKMLFNDEVMIKITNLFLGLTLLRAIVRFITDKKIPVALLLGITVMFIGYIYRRYIMKEGIITKKQRVLQNDLF